MNARQLAYRSIWSHSQAAHRGDQGALAALVYLATAYHGDEEIRSAAMSCLTEWEGGAEIIPLRRH